ncbi:MAG: 1,4-dihydroxy-6-naphthoate synthase [bacterium]
MKLSIGISPCPNDTFIFDAMLNGKVDTEGLSFDYRLEDVETLNKLANTSSLDISKVSYGAVHNLLERYIILNSGGALGKGVGPLVVSKKFSEKMLPPHESRIALPGVNTTAHLLFSMIFPEHTNKVFMPFDLIQDAIISGSVDAGVIIHENRFTYHEKGLNKITDLGDEWEKVTELPIPLGGIIARRDLDTTILKTIDRVIARSLEHALQQGHELPEFVTANAQEMSESVMINHINLYVNDYSLAMGEMGRSAVRKLLNVSQQINSTNQILTEEMFLD